MKRPWRWTAAALAALALAPAARPAPAAAPEPLGPSTDALSAWDVTSRTHPQDDAVILFRGVSVAMDPDGRITRRVRIVQRLLSEAAVAERGDPRIAYDTTCQELAVGTCLTVMRDGRRVPATPHAFNRVTPERVASCPDRASLQEMVVSYLGVERGCLTELDYTVSDKIAWRPWLEGIEELGDEAPVLSGSVTLRFPGRALRRAIVGAAVGLQERGEGSWSYGPLPACPDEGGSPERERIPYLVYSTCPSWDSLAAWTRGRLAAAAIPDSAIAVWSRGDLESGRPPLDDRERLRRIARLISARTLAADDAPLTWWLPVRPAARAFDASCGNLLDRAALAWAALRASGIAADPLLHPACAALARDVPALVQFDDVWLAASPGPLSVAGGTSGDRVDPGAAAEMLELGPAAAGFLPVPRRGASSLLSIRLHEQVDGSWRGEASLEAGGPLCRGIETEDLKAFLDGLAASYVDGGELAGYSVATLSPDTLALALSFAGKRLGEAAGGGRARFRLPCGPGMPDAALPAGLALRHASRATAIALPFPVVEEVRVRLEPRAGRAVVVLPEQGIWRGPGVSVEFSAARDGPAWRLRRRFETATRTVAPEAYPAFRAVVLRRIDEASNEIVIGPAGGR